MTDKELKTELAVIRQAMKSALVNASADLKSIRDIDAIVILKSAILEFDAIFENVDLLYKELK